jgi:hypothetical protein
MMLTPNFMMASFPALVGTMRSSVKKRYCAKPKILAANHFSVELWFCSSGQQVRRAPPACEQYSAVLFCIWSLKKLGLEEKDRDEYARVRKEKQAVQASLTG